MKSPQAFRSIGEVARLVGVATHVLRYWETQFPALAPVRRPDGRRYYRPDDLLLAAGLCEVMREDGLTIRGAQRLIARDKGAALRERGRLRLEATERRAIEEKAPARRKVASGPRTQRAEQAEDALAAAGEAHLPGPAPLPSDAQPLGGAVAERRESLREQDAAMAAQETGARQAGDHARAPHGALSVDVARGLGEAPTAGNVGPAPAGPAEDAGKPVRLEQAAQGTPGLSGPQAGKDEERGVPGQRTTADAGRGRADLPLTGQGRPPLEDDGGPAPEGQPRPAPPGRGTGAWLGRLAATAAALRARRQPLPPDVGSLHDALRRMQDDG